MKYLPLILAGLRRKPVRTVLTFLSIVVAFILFGILFSVQSNLARRFEMMRLDRLYVDARFGGPQPMAYRSRIAAVPGVRAVIPVANLNGYWKERRNPFGVVMTNPDYVLARPEYTVTRTQLEALERRRNGVIISQTYARRYGWRVGDRIPLTSTVAQQGGNPVWTLEIMGIADNRDDTGTMSFALGSYRFFDEGRAGGKGTVNRFIVRIPDGEQAAAMSRTIDRVFANSPQPTRTLAERMNTGGGIGSSQSDITFFTHSIIGAVLFMILFITGNTMMQSMRERIPEFAVFKTLGFTDGGVLALVLAETTILCLTAGLVGLGLARMSGSLLGAILPGDAAWVLAMPAVALAAGLAAALLMSALASVIPALRLKRMNVVHALAGR